MNAKSWRTLVHVIESVKTSDEGGSNCIEALVVAGVVCGSIPDAG